MLLVTIYYRTCAIYGAVTSVSVKALEVNRSIELYVGLTAAAITVFLI